MSDPAMQDLSVVLGQVQAQLSALSQRIERLEEAAAARARPAAAPAKIAAAPRPEPVITEEEVLAISAALAAYLGVRPHIKQIRLVSSPAWAQQGRVSIQASHRLHN